MLYRIAAVVLLLGFASAAPVQKTPKNLPAGKNPANYVLPSDANWWTDLINGYATDFVSLHEKNTEQDGRLDALEAFLAAIPDCGANMALTHTATGLSCVAVAGGTTPELPGPGLGPLGAFPGCEGSGCETRGGFTGTPTIYRVTSTSTGTGAGTLGQCLAASGPRVCVFAVGGKITTGTGYEVTNPYVTVRCDTAPGDGVQISAEGQATVTNPSGEKRVLLVRTHDVVFRGCKIRNGETSTTSGADAGAFGAITVSAADDIHHVVMDHVSFQFGRDGAAGFYGWSQGPGGQPDTAKMPRQSQIGWSIISDGLKRNLASGYSRGGIIGGDATAADDAMVDIDVHHNLYANLADRQPLFRLKRARVINNLYLNWGRWALKPEGGGGDIDMIGNLGKRSTSAWAWTGAEALSMQEGFLGMEYTGGGAAMNASGTQSIYLAGNAYDGEGVKGWGTNIITLDSRGANGEDNVTHRSTPLAAPTTGPAITVSPAADLPTTLLGAGGVGASRRLDCGGAWVATRDSVDARVVGEWGTPRTGTFTIPDQVTDIGGWPTIATVTAACAGNSRDNASCVCADTDTDGIPDYWEAAFCGSATACAPLGTNVSAPWTNIEAFMSGTKAAP
jgi:pectate lyase